jgi:NAD dependent epimerase/dehydratase family enzyme
VRRQPEVGVEHGFAFRHTDLEQALRDAVGHT